MSRWLYVVGSIVTDGSVERKTLERALGKRGKTSGRLPAGSEGPLDYRIIEEKHPFGKNYVIPVWGHLRDVDNADDLRAWFDRIAYETEGIDVIEAAIDYCVDCSEHAVLRYDEKIAEVFDDYRKACDAPTKEMTDKYGGRKVYIYRKGRPADVIKGIIRPVSWCSEVDTDKGPIINMECDSLPFDFTMTADRDYDPESPKAWLKTYNDTYVAFNRKAFHAMIEEFEKNDREKYESIRKL